MARSNYPIRGVQAIYVTGKRPHPWRLCLITHRHKSSPVEAITNYFEDSDRVGIRKVAFDVVGQGTRDDEEPQYLSG
ncbi:hypothetical protein DPMN_193891 [Dreissena polymorpha]|uniref:Uncharacterized protein n=1 Tax=Dreissena polymorpha TaxID=45954 RepID=A0A9D4BF29_DREPO|nr:hypothetical protein DPMN_193891 [Dreissena polymorpha]